MLPVLHTPEEIAEAFQVTAWWVKEQARRRRCDAIKVAGQWRFTDAQVAALLDLHASAAVPEEQATNPARRQSVAPAELEVVEPTPLLQARPPRRRRPAA